MGKLWDKAEVQGFTLKWGKEVLRVLKPGAYLLSFGGTRTYHRMTCALEDVGFEIRDCLMWLYGCLSSDTELLVNGQWVDFRRVKAGDHALLFDAQSNKIYWGPVLEVYVYEYDDAAYRIFSERTDQIVSRNHRVAVERDGVVHFQTAESIAQERQVRIPILESLSEVPRYFPRLESHPSIAEQDVQALSYCETEGATREEAVEDAGRSDGRLCGVREGEVDSECLAQEGQDASVFSALQRDSERKASDTILPSRSRGLDGRELPKLSREDVWGKESCVERRGHDIQEARQLRRGSLCQMPKGVSVNGSEGRLCHGASADRGEGIESVSFEVGSGASYQSYSIRQSVGELRTLPNQSGTQVGGVGQWVSDLARIEPIHYRGIVWCIRTPTGAFVARRNGKIFITGNSGFPKSLDVSKAIDKHLGCFVKGEPTQNSRRGDRPSDFAMSEITSSNPQSPEAHAWSGWGTALKPAYEPIVLARKPLDGTVAKNVLKYGTGGINVDGCRIRFASEEDKEGTGRLFQEWHTPPGDGIRHGKMKVLPGLHQNDIGRWPSNVLLGDEEVAKMLDEQSGESESKPGIRHRTDNNIYGVASSVGEPCEMPYNDKGGASRFFYVAKASRSEREKGLENRPTVKVGVLEGRQDGSLGGPIPVAKNFHPTVKPLELMRYLVKLVTPKDGLCLDPFLGSGTTLIACMLEGTKALGIEKDAENEPIIKGRLEYWRPIAEGRRTEEAQDRREQNLELAKTLKTLDSFDTEQDEEQLGDKEMTNGNKVH